MASETPAAASPAPTAEPAAEPSNETQASVAKGSPPLGPRLLLLLVIPAIVVGVVSALGLLLATEIARAISDVFWTSIPTSIGIDGNGPFWIFLMLLLTGVAVGLVITFAPGHAGQDPATIELVSPPLPPMALPGLALAMILMLAGGVSLGPENPIIAVNTGIVVALGVRLIPRMPIRGWAGLSFSGTIGAMFGTPIAAALALSELPSDDKRPLWDRIFAPLVAACAGAITMNLLGAESFALSVDPYGAPQQVDVLFATVIGVVAAAVTLLAIYAFPHAHRAFVRLRSPLLAIIVGSAILGVLGAIGGPITLFKGLSQMQELTADVASYSTLQLGSFFVIKVVAVVIAATCGFRGGRIFPSVFASVALGLFVHSAFPAIPMAIALSGSIIGVLVAVTRSGWLSLFLAATMIGDMQLLPLMTVVVLASWVVATGRPLMVVPIAEAMPGQGPLGPATPVPATATPATPAG